MKSTNGKKKNLTINHTLDSYGAILNGPNGPVQYKPPFIMPPPYHGYCHQCNKGFLSLEELQAHWIIEHVGKY